MDSAGRWSSWSVSYPLLLTVVGTLLNLLTLLILCRSSFGNGSKRPTLHYMRTIAICDVLILYGWNFDHYLERAVGIRMSTYTVLTCKLFTFLNYVIHHVSAWLRVLICFDRYLSLSRLYRTWFSLSKNVLLVIVLVVLVFVLFNLHFLPFVCYYDEHGQVQSGSHYYAVYPMWDHVNLIVYNGLPLALMLVFNSGVMYHLVLLRRLSKVRKTSRIQHRAISVTLLLNTSLFFLMTTPASVAYAFFSRGNETVLYVLDSMLYTYHVLGFPVYFLTFTEFRREFWQLVTLYKCRKLSTVHQHTPKINVVNRLFTISETSLK